MLVIVPVSLPGQQKLRSQSPDRRSRILHTQGGVWVNGYEAKDSSAVFPGDLLETKPGSSANLNLDGSTVLIQPESVAKLQTNLLELDHGGVFVGTSKSFKVRVNCLTVVPVLNEWTQYEVNDVNGNVQVAARKDDVNVESGSGSARSPRRRRRRKRRTDPPFTRRNKRASTNRRSAAPRPDPGSRNELESEMDCGGARQEREAFYFACCFAAAAVEARPPVSSCAAVTAKSLPSRSELARYRILSWV